jgi:hypothetical protein
MATSKCPTLMPNKPPEAMERLRISHTIHPTTPPQGWEQWAQYIHRAVHPPRQRLRTTPMPTSPVVMEIPGRATIKI